AYTGWVRGCVPCPCETVPADRRTPGRRRSGRSASLHPSEKKRKAATPEAIAPAKRRLSRTGHTGRLGLLAFVLRAFSFRAFAMAAPDASPPPRSTGRQRGGGVGRVQDRKSTRLNSSHV